MEGEFQYLAPSVLQFLDSWLTGQIIL
jgi:hypothetical protein